MFTFAKAGAAFSVVQSAASTLGPTLASAAGAAALIPAALIGGVGILAAMKLGADGIKKAFEGLKPTLDTLKSQVSQSIQSGLTPGVNALKSSLPGLRVGLQSIGMAAGQAFSRVAAVLNQNGNTGKVNGIFIEMSKVIQNVGKAMAPLVQAFINIGAIGAPILTQLTAGIGSVAEKFSAWTSSAEGAATIKNTITAAIEAFKTLGQILQQIVGIATNVFTGLSSGAGGLAGTFLPALKAINAALGSEGMQKALGGIGNALATVGQAVGSTLGPVVQTVLPLLSQALQTAAPGIAALVQGFGELIKGVAPALPAIGQLAAVLGGGLGQVAAALGPVLGQLASVLAGTLATAIPPLIPVITSLVQIVGQILTAVAPLIGPLVELAAAALTPILAIIQALIPPFTTLIGSVLGALKPLIPPISQAFQQLGQALAPLAGALGNAIVQIFMALLPIVQPLVGVIVSLVQAFIPLIPVITSFIGIITPIITLVAQVAAAITGFMLSALQPLIDLFGIGMTAISAAMTGINNIIASVVSTVTGIFSGLVSKISGAWSSITSTIGNAVGKVKTAISNGFNEAVSFVSSIPGKIIGALGDFGSMLFNAGKSIIQGLINGIKNMIGSVKDAIGGVLSAARNLLPFSPAKEGPFSGKGWTLYSGRSISEALAQGIREKGGLAVDAMEQTMAAVSGVTAAPKFGSSVNAAVQNSVSAAANFTGSPITVVVEGDEKGMAGFIDARVEEGNRSTRRFVQARKGAAK
jgi:phage-related protein